MDFWINISKLCDSKAKINAWSECDSFLDTIPGDATPHDGDNGDFMLHVYVEDESRARQVCKDFGMNSANALDLPVKDIIEACVHEELARMAKWNIQFECDWMPTAIVTIDIWGCDGMEQAVTRARLAFDVNANVRMIRAQAST